MPTEPPRIQVESEFDRAAREYLLGLPPEHFMESTDQAMQREIFLESLAVVRAVRPDVHVYNELLIQTRIRRRKRLVQVVPDNCVCVYAGELVASGSYNVPEQPVGPFWVLEYVSKSNPRKDYEDSREKYEKYLKVPYYLFFNRDKMDLLLLRLTGEEYEAVEPNAADRLAIPELEIEAALHDGWVRFWFRGELLPLPDELVRQLSEARRRAESAERRADAAERRADAAEEARRGAEAESARLREELARILGRPSDV